MVARRASTTKALYSLKCCSEMTSIHT